MSSSFLSQPIEYPGSRRAWIEPPPYVDLVAKTMQLYVNHSEGSLCVAGILYNSGNSIPTPHSGTITVAIGITVVIEGITRSQEEQFTIANRELLPGVQIESDCSKAPLVYRDEDPGAKYTLELLVDLHHEVTDVDRSNNWVRFPWWITNPANAGLTRIGDIAAELEAENAVQSGN